MRIIHLIPYFPPAHCFGGTPEAVYALARAQAQLGHEVYVITSDAGLQKGGEHPELQLEWIESPLIRAIGCNPEMKIIYARNRRPALAGKKIFTASFWNRDIEKWLPGVIDILHFHEVHIPGYRAIFQSLVPKKNINAFMSAHGSLKPPTHTKIRGFVHKLTDPILRAGWFDKLQGYFALSRAEQKQYLSCGIDPSRIHILPHGKPEFPPSPLPLPFTIPAMQEGPTFLFVGRLNSAKGILTMLQAFIENWREGKRGRLLVCGPDEGGIKIIRSHCHADSIPLEEEKCKALPGVYLLGSCPHGALPRLYRAADWTLCPSPYESFGLVPLESLLCGVPVIISSAYGCLEHLSISHSLCHILPANDVKAWQISMQKVFATKNHPSGFSVDFPAWEEIGLKTTHIYENPLAKGEVHL